MVAFGFMDNTILIRAGDAIDNGVGKTLGLACAGVGLQRHRCTARSQQTAVCLSVSLFVFHQFKLRGGEVCEIIFSRCTYNFVLSKGFVFGVLHGVWSKRSVRRKKTLFQRSMASAGVAQCLSDTCGVLFGGTVLAAVSKLGFDEPALTRAQRNMRLIQASEGARRDRRCRVHDV